MGALVNSLESHKEGAVPGQPQSESHCIRDSRVGDLRATGLPWAFGLLVAFRCGAVGFASL